MKIIKKLSAFIIVACLLISIIPCASADGLNEEYFDGRSWEEVIADFFEKHRIDHDRITLGYYNTVTGEEHYYQPDKYMVGASVYKVPLNMAYAEKISKGEMDWDSLTPYEPYEDLMRNSIIYSNNEDSGTLMFNLGGTYRGFLNYIAPYLGVDTETVEPQYYNEQFTARQFVSCLKTLYHESERFPKIIETMKEAEPKNYFRMREQRYELAHKYGYWPGEYLTHVNDVGIVYTDDPIVIVMFTASVANALEVMTDYCTLMCDYTQYHRAKRLAAEAEEAARLKAALDDARADLASKALVSESIEAVPLKVENEKSNGSALLISAAVVLAAIVALAAVLFSKRHKKNRFLICTVIIICAAATVLCLLLGSVGTVFTRPKGDPRETVTAFFDALNSGDYDSAYSHISGYTSLGLENTPSDSVSKAAYDALKASYKYKLLGNCSVDKRSASQQLEFSYLELSSVKGDVSSVCIDKLEEIAAERSQADLYSEDSKFLPAVSEEAFELAVNEVLKTPEKHCVTDTIQIQLEYKDERWLIIPDAALINALSGGIVT